MREHENSPLARNICFFLEIDLNKITILPVWADVWDDNI